MRQISGGHEIRPRGGLLLVTTLDFHYRPSIRENESQCRIENCRLTSETLIVDAVYNFYRPCKLIHACIYFAVGLGVYPVPRHMWIL